eukprot:876414-Prorocentrum_minimum.AAC.1
MNRGPQGVTDPTVALGSALLPPKLTIRAPPYTNYYTITRGVCDSSRQMWQQQQQHGGLERIYRSSLDARRPQNPTN